MLWSWPDIVVINFGLPQGKKGVGETVRMGAKVRCWCCQVSLARKGNASRSTVYKKAEEHGRDVQALDWVSSQTDPLSAPVNNCLSWVPPGLSPVSPQTQSIQAGRVSEQKQVLSRTSNCSTLRLGSQSLGKGLEEISWPAVHFTLAIRRKTLGFILKTKTSWQSHTQPQLLQAYKRGKNCFKCV